MGITIPWFICLSSNTHCGLTVFLLLWKKNKEVLERGKWLSWKSFAVLSGNPRSITRNSLKAEGEDWLLKAVLWLPDTSYILPPFMHTKTWTLICDMVSINMHVSYRIMLQTTANGGGIPKTCQTSHGSRMPS